MTSILQFLHELDEIFQKYEDLRKRLISPTKDFLNELVAWKKRFIREYGEE